mgnify:FL=1
MGDAAKDLGFGGLAEVSRLYNVCYEIAEHVKGGAEAERTAALLFQSEFPVSNVADLRETAIRIGTRIQNAAALAPLPGATGRGGRMDLMGLGQATPGRDGRGKGIRNENM